MRNQILSRITLVYLGLVFSLAILVACTTRQNQQDQQNQNKIVIGVSMDTLREERWQRDQQAMIKRAQELGMDIRILSANGSDALQIAQAKSLVDTGVDVLIVIPHNAEIAAEIVEYAHEKGVPVIAYDRLIQNSDLDAYISYDNEKIGQFQVEYLAKMAPTGNYVYIGGASIDNNAKLLRKGVQDALQPYLQTGEIKLVYDEMTDNWSPSIAQQHMEKALEDNNNNIAAVIAANDNLAGGVIAALAEQQLAGKVPVAGMDADLAGLRRIVEGTQTMTIYKPTAQLVNTALEIASALAKNEKFDANAAVYNGKIEVPSVLIEPTVVDQSNIMDTVIKEGYQSYEKVYESILEEERPKR